MGAESCILNKTVFLDRDGVINKCARPHEYVKEWRDFEFISGSAEGIRLLNERGYRIVVVSNQRGVARGLLRLSDVNTLHDRMCGELNVLGAKIDQIYVCPHEYGTCRCRKPDIGLFLQAEQDMTVDKKHSFMIGDSATDMEAGKRYGVKTVLIGGNGSADYRCESLYEAARLIVRLEMA